ncbi:hypothetical protein [Bradyrhizobium sp.]
MPAPVMARVGGDTPTDTLKKIANVCERCRTVEMRTWREVFDLQQVAEAC